MDLAVQTYVENIQREYESGHAREHSCRPAQKWLKDRKGRALSFEDLMHYQKMIVSLAETERLMGEIDQVAKSLFV